MTFQFLVVPTGGSTQFRPERFVALEPALAYIEQRWGKLHMEGRLEDRPSGGCVSTSLAWFWHNKKDRDFDRSQGNRASTVCFLSVRRID